MTPEPVFDKLARFTPSADFARPGLKCFSAPASLGPHTVGLETGVSGLLLWSAVLLASDW